jgi:hypothetical protein
MVTTHIDPGVAGAFAPMSGLEIGLAWLAAVAIAGALVIVVCAALERLPRAAWRSLEPHRNRLPGHGPDDGLRHAA